MANFIDTEMLSAGRYLSTTKAIRVPEYQRSYAWTEDEVSQLWVDLIDSMENSRPEYFIGPIVVKRATGGEVELIDGQQRLTTILALISVLRSTFRANGDSARADLFSSRFFGERDIITLENSDKFFMNEENGNIFRNFISKEVAIELIKDEIKKYAKKSSNHLLLNAYQTIFDLSKSFTNQKFDSQKLLSLYTYLTDNVKVLVLSVNDEADAYTIFETLNDRGRSLDTLDLLKNHLFSKAKTYLSEVKKNWAGLKENLIDVDPKNRFLHHFWSSLHGRTSTTGLFRAIRDQIHNAKEAVDFSNKLTQASRIYNALQNSSSQFWDEHPTETKSNIATLQLLDAQQALPILIAAEEKFTKDEFRKLTRLLVVMAVRYNFIGEERTGVAANYYSDIPKPIRSGTITKASHVFASLKPIYPNDQAFEDAFKSKSISDTKRARYILSEIENNLSDGAKVVNLDPDEVNLEHILPKNINQHWKIEETNVNQDEHKYFINRIGNLALTPKEINKKAGAKDFLTKKKELFSQCTDFTTTLEICNYDTWTRQTIESRQARLAKVATKTWCYGPE